jgi:hypothetical protein
MLPQVFAHAEDLNRVGCVQSIDEIKLLDCLLKPPTAQNFGFSFYSSFFFHFSTKLMFCANGNLKFQTDVSLMNIG